MLCFLREFVCGIDGNYKLILKRQLDVLMGSLNVKGIRERALKRQLENFYNTIRYMYLHFHLLLLGFISVGRINGLTFCLSCYKQVFMTLIMCFFYPNDYLSAWYNKCTCYLSSANILKFWCYNVHLIFQSSCTH